LGKINIRDLSSELELDRTTVLRNIEKLIKMDLVSYNCENDNKNKLIQLTSTGENKTKRSHYFLGKNLTPIY
tara:strand:- start:360 stop:575 length:216 start_codon:yes stop_codon:yes gene_type:complete